mgnify:CR=1 FL=1
MAMKKVVIFDLDGTLTNSLASMKLSGDMAMAKFGMGPYTEDQYKVFVGDGARVLVERCLIAGGDTELKNLDAAYEEYCKVFEKYCMYKVEPYDGIRELLSALKEKGVKIAVLSNKPHERTKDVIKAVFGEGYFDVVQGQQDETVPHRCVQNTGKAVPHTGGLVVHRRHRNRHADRQGGRRVYRGRPVGL